MEIKRNQYLEQLKSKEWNGMIKVITGLRRSGKSYLLFNLFTDYLMSKGIGEKRIIKVVLDDLDNEHLREKHALYDYIKSQILDENQYYVLIDEIQLVDEFSDVLNSLLHRKNVDTYVTGSNSKFLSTDILTEFRGRGDEIRVYPLSFKEFMSVYDGDFEDAWDDYYRYGGLPHITELNTEKEKSDYLKTLFAKTYLTDILDRHRIRNKEEMDELLDVLSSAVGSYTNPSKLSKTFKSVKNKSIKSSTLKNYIDYLKDAFLISEAKRYNVKGKRYINSPAKFFFEDIGLRNARLNFRQTEENHIMENIIYNELRIRGFDVDVGVVEVFVKDKMNKTERRTYEIDFVANKGNNKIYIQSAYKIPSSEKENQELKSLRNVSDSFRKIVVVEDRIKPRRYEDGIELMGLKYFLLNDWE